MSADTQGDLTLSQLLARGVDSHDAVLAAPSANDAAIQKTLQRALSDLTLSSSLVARLGILSPNETIDDMHTASLACILVPALRADLELLARTTSGKERIVWLERAKTHFTEYVELVDRYEVVPEERRAVFAGPKHATQDPTRRREAKIAQFKLERELKGKLEELRARRSTHSVDEVAQDSDDDDDDDVARPIELAMLQLAYLRAHAELASIEQEMELLESSIAMSDLPGRIQGVRTEGDRERGREGDDEDGTWRVEKLEDRTGPMLDPQGKVLRPFTILPSSSSSPMATRLRLQSEVFRSGHRLPTMTIDEFLENEEAAGRILQGGGPASSEAVDQERRDQQADREDDTAAGYRKDDLEKDKARKWDEYTDTHRKGEGNMHNRG